MIIVRRLLRSDLFLKLGVSTYTGDNFVSAVTNCYSECLPPPHRMEFTYLKYIGIMITLIHFYPIVNSLAWLINPTELSEKNDKIANFYGHHHELVNEYDICLSRDNLY